MKLDYDKMRPEFQIEFDMGKVRRAMLGRFDWRLRVFRLLVLLACRVLRVGLTITVEPPKMPEPEWQIDFE